MVQFLFLFFYYHQEKWLYPRPAIWKSWPCPIWLPWSRQPSENDQVPNQLSPHHLQVAHRYNNFVITVITHCTLDPRAPMTVESSRVHPIATNNLTHQETRKLSCCTSDDMMMMMMRDNFKANYFKLFIAGNKAYWKQKHNIIDANL